MKADPDHGFGEDEMGGPFWWDDQALPVPNWREIFDGATPKEVLRNLIEGDPLQAFPYSWAFICENALLVEPERLFLRVAANLAVRSCAYQGQPALLDLLAEVQESSIKELMEEDLEAERNGYGIDQENLPGFRFLVPDATGIEDSQTRRATVVFNHLGEEDRLAFFHVIAEGLSVEEYAEESGLAVDSVVEQIGETTQKIVRGCIAPNDKGDPFGDNTKDLS